MGYLFDTNKRLGRRGLFQNATEEDVLNQPPASPSFLPTQAQTADPFGSQDTIKMLQGMQSIPPEPDILPAQDRQEPFGSPFNSTNPVLGQMPTEVQPKAGLYDEWKTPVRGTGLPLDRFVQLTGMAAHALDPKGFGGILGKSVAGMGAQAEQGRLGYEERQAETARRDAQYQEQKTLLLQQHKESRAAQAAGVGEKLVGNKNASLSQKQAGMEMISGYIKMIAPDITIPSFNAEEDGAFAKEVSSIAKDKNLNNAQKKESILDKMHETGKIDDATYIKERFPADKTEQQTLYGPDGQTKRVPIDKGQAFTPEAGWSLQAPAAAQTPSWQDKGVTEKGGLPIMFNPKDTSLMVKNADGTTAPYDPKIHGKQLSATVNQTTIYNNQQGGQTLKPGTTEYWASIYETTGQVPSFGMGNKGAEQRRAFLDKVAERAIARGDGENGAAQAVRQADFKASQSTLTDLTKREQLINSYNVRINETSDKVLVPLIKRWDLQNPRFLNWPVNKLSEVMGSGDLASLKLALNSVSVEVGKVEFNAIGIQQLTDSASKFMNSVHDPNMKVGELIKVVNTSRALGDTGISAITKQRKELMSRMKGIKPPQDQPAGGGFDMNAIEAELLRRKLGK